MLHLAAPALQWNASSADWIKPAQRLPGVFVRPAPTFSRRAVDYSFTWSSRPTLIQDGSHERLSCPPPEVLSTGDALPTSANVPLVRVRGRVRPAGLERHGHTASAFPPFLCDRQRRRGAQPRCSAERRVLRARLAECGVLPGGNRAIPARTPALQLASVTFAEGFGHLPGAPSDLELAGFARASPWRTRKRSGTAARPLCKPTRQPDGGRNPELPGRDGGQIPDG